MFPALKLTLVGVSFVWSTLCKYQLLYRFRQLHRGADPRSQEKTRPLSDIPVLLVPKLVCLDCLNQYE